MTKTIIEERIKKEAQNKLYREWGTLYNFLKSNPLAQKFKIGGFGLTGGGGSEQQYIGEYLPNIEGDKSANSIHTKTNFREALAVRLSELEKQELDDILNKLANLNYLFEN